MRAEDVERWRKNVLARLDVLKSKARQARQRIESRNLVKLNDSEEIVSAWQKIEELFPDDFSPPRVADLSRHLSFAEAVDFHDIENLDIPAVENAVSSYRRQGDDYVKHELGRPNY